MISVKGPHGMSHLSIVCSGCVGVAALTTLLGCGGSSQATVSGKVTLDGQPLPSGTISFVPADGATATAGKPIADGAYSVEMPPGPKRVQISATKVIGQRVVYQGDPNSPVVDDVREIIPPQYNAATTLTFNATAGSQKQDFELKSAP